MANDGPVLQVIFGLFQLVSAYSLSQNTIESAETSRLFHHPNQPDILVWPERDSIANLPPTGPGATYHVLDAAGRRERSDLSSHEPF
jgi:hypothetical protein